MDTQNKEVTQTGKLQRQWGMSLSLQFSLSQVYHTQFNLIANSNRFGN